MDRKVLDRTGELADALSERVSRLRHRAQQLAGDNWRRFDLDDGVSKMAWDTAKVDLRQLYQQYRLPPLPPEAALPFLKHYVQNFRAQDWHGGYKTFWIWSAIKRIERVELHTAWPPPRELSDRQCLEPARFYECYAAHADVAQRIENLNRSAAYYRQYILLVEVKKRAYESYGRQGDHPYRNLAESTCRQYFSHFKVELLTEKRESQEGPEGAILLPDGYDRKCLLADRQGNLQDDTLENRAKIYEEDVHGIDSLELAEDFLRRVVGDHERWERLEIQIIGSLRDIPGFRSVDEWDERPTGKDGAVSRVPKLVRVQWDDEEQVLAAKLRAVVAPPQLREVSPGLSELTAFAHRRNGGYVIEYKVRFRNGSYQGMVRRELAERVGTTFFFR